MRGRPHTLDAVTTAPSAGSRPRSARSRHVLTSAFALILVLLAAMVGASAASAASSVAAWGANDDGQLGDGTTTGPSKCLVSGVEHACSPTPGPAGELGPVAAVAAGQFHSLALLGDGTVMAWGRNSSGQLGTGNTTASDIPVPVAGLSGVTAVAAGSTHSLALLSNGSVVAWGANESGQLGNGTTVASDVPVAVSGLSGVTAIAAGNGYSLALLGNGTVMAWGTNQTGQLGDGTTTTRTLPVAVSGLSGATAIAAGFAHSLAVLGDGTVVAWGYNRFGQLGDGTFEGPSTCVVNGSALPCSKTPVAVIGLSEVASVAAGEQHSLALKQSGAVAAWGGNEEGELGNATREDSSLPVNVLEMSGATAIAAGGRSSFAIVAGIVEGWGENSYGQLGDGTELERILPTPVCGLVGVSGLASRGAHTLAAGGTPSQCPAVSSISPMSGPSSGGTTVTITGTALGEATAVKFGTVAATSFTVNSETSITAVSPPATGVVPVTVKTPAGTSKNTPADIFTFVAQPTVSAISPTSGASSGGAVVTITGTGFSEVTAVQFGTAGATSFTVHSPTSITAVAPPGSGTVDVTVTNSGGTSTATSADKFTYFLVAAPEFGRCLKVTAGQGGYGNSTCTSAGGTKTYEWYPAFVGSKPLVKTHFTTAIKSLTQVFLDTATSGQRITCTGETGKGEYSGPKTVAGVILKLTGCHRGELGSCASAGSVEGEVLTSALTGTLGIVKTSTEGPLKNKLGLSLRPAPETPFAEFTCAGVAVVVRGAVIDEVKANSMLLTATLKYSESKGIQKPSHFEGGTTEVLEESLNGEPFHQAGLALTMIQTNEEKVEASSIV